MVTRSGNATTLSFFPGFNENSSEGGDELNNGLPDFEGLAVDDWFTGDFQEELEADYNLATDIDRELEEFPDERFYHYRFKNRIEVTFDTPDNQTIDEESVNPTYNTDIVYVTLEDEGNPLRDSSVRSELDITQDKRKAEPRPRYHNWKVGSVDGIDAVHTASIWGAYDPYVEKMVEYASTSSSNSLLELLFNETERALLGSGTVLLLEFIFGTPAIWTWLEHTMLADGTELVRVWDASDFPEHVGYLGAADPESRDDILIEWEANEFHNEAFDKWSTLAQLPTAGPYQSLKWEYKRDFDGFGPFDQDPKMAYGWDPNRPTGERGLSASEVNDMLSDGYAVDPFDNKTTY
jgi:hypothetical protein